MAVGRSDESSEELLERKQPIARLTLIECKRNWTHHVPILKYTFLVGASLLALIVVAGHVMEPAPADTASKQASASSLELLRKKANHGETKPFASAAAAGPFLAMPVGSPAIALAEAPVARPVTIAAVPTAMPSALNAQAQLEDSIVAEKPARPVKKTVARKPKPRVTIDYVENAQRAAGGFFGGFQTW